MDGEGLEDVSCGLRWKGEFPVGTSAIWFVGSLIGPSLLRAILLPVKNIIILTCLVYGMIFGTLASNRSPHITTWVCLSTHLSQSFPISKIFTTGFFSRIWISALRLCLNL